MRKTFFLAVIAAISILAASCSKESKEVQTETLTIKARPLANGYVKAKTGDTTTAETYNNWYSEVYMPAVGTA